MKITKIAALLTSAVMCVMCFSGCGKEETPALDADTIVSAFSEAVRKDFSDRNVDVDTIGEVAFEPVSVNEEEMDALKERFPSQVPYQVEFCSADISNVTMEAHVDYRVVFAYNGEWKYIAAFPFDKDNWSYSAKDVVNKKTIMDALKTKKFGSLPEGRVGDDKYSSIEIANRKYDEITNKETINLDVTARLNYGNLLFKVEALYYFLEGSWSMGDIQPDDMKNWSVEFNSGYELAEISDKEIVKKLTTKDEFLTYVADGSVYESGTLTKDYYDCTPSDITVHYTFDTVYSDIGSVQYEVTAFYEWLSYEWSEPEIAVNVKSFDFSPMIGQSFIADNGDVLTLKEITPPADELDDKISLDLHFSLSSSGGDRDMVANILVPARDNNWVAIIKGSDSHNNDAVDSVSIYVDSKSLLYKNEQRFYLNGDKSLIKIEIPEDNPEETTEPETEEPTEAPSTEETSETTTTVGDDATSTETTTTE